MQIVEYNRQKAKEYAKKWAYLRNPNYYDYDKLGGDCTNFVSQCIFAGALHMNYSQANGWYYKNANQKSPSWTGVEFLHQFLTQNKSVGPFGKIVDIDKLQVGDIIQLSFDGNVYGHSLLVVEKNANNLEKIYVATHTFDSYGRKVSSYIYQKIRMIHIEGVRKW
ncbi:MAG: amidase domain-containing protein [Clostridia bacterium]|nr:amidase domain-containing protein [Clostridia bacterium]